jgi:hypothetical protein
MPVEILALAIFDELDDSEEHESVRRELDEVEQGLRDCPFGVRVRRAADRCS